mgnify:CR=1 FL=1
MSFNPFNEKGEKTTAYESWKQLYPRAYDKNSTDPKTKMRIILMNGTEFEAQWFLHNMARHTADNDLRRELAVLRRCEQQEQKKMSYLKPIDESILETTIGYEQLAVELTALMARKEKDPTVKKALDFALLEDFDHLYRYADLLEMDCGIRAETLVGKKTEIMPGRPTVSEHRYPSDDIKKTLTKDSPLLSKLHSMIITAAEQQTMNFYMNCGTFYGVSELGRKLFLEIAMIEEQHVSLYESLQDASATWLECLLMHEYAECYLYYSMLSDETDDRIRSVWSEHLMKEIGHLHTAARLLEKYENKHWSQVIPDGAFPELISFSEAEGGNMEYIRKVLKNTVGLTAAGEGYVNVSEVPEDSAFFRYNRKVNGAVSSVASHKVIDRYIAEAGEDYRFQVSAHPVPGLRDRSCDNTDLGRTRAPDDCGRKERRKN